MGTNEKKMTTGSPGKLIITFAIPLMLGNILQQFYTMADTMIVGQVVGVEALAAVGAGDWLVWLVFGIMTGITQGFSIHTCPIILHRTLPKRNPSQNSLVYRPGILRIPQEVFLPGHVPCWSRSWLDRSPLSFHNLLLFYRYFP